VEKGYIKAKEDFLNTKPGKQAPMFIVVWIMER